ncbi:thioesterase family protein [Alteromonas lipolytica]|uniref:Thioesterase n=1 Tax=Alteromonas lipolytica TaxID=1856405 RepID=A0A1E8FJ45_9ALTE|nr:thioesterase family protein [Alteromonas lipolytica]OFI35638.1 hypothetical protein BFC17_12860 [Alteromonas lipolytica]GGF77823.1 hypothetical protein GCM10011338_32740 [Alteromonas lipolytica]
MEPQTGISVLYTRVERWECDHNDHWNTRFYARTMQEASLTLKARFAVSPNSEHAGKTFNIRYFRELRVLDLIEVRSARYQSCTIHLLFCSGRLAAAGIDYTFSCEALPEIGEDDLSSVLPRGTVFPANVDAVADFTTQPTQLGRVNQIDMDDELGIRQEILVRHCAISNTVFMNQMGLTADWRREKKYGFMAAEMGYTELEPVMPGMVLQAYSKITEQKPKSLNIEHLLTTHDGTPVVHIQMVQLCVSLETRKVVELVLPE